MAVYMNLALHTCPLQALISQKLNSNYTVWLDLKEHRFKCVPNAKPILTPFNILNIFTNTVLVSASALYILVGQEVFN